MRARPQHLEQIYPVQTFHHLLASKIVGHFVVKRQDYVRKPELCMGKHPHRMRQSLRPTSERNRDLFLNFLGCPPG
jgi:hypothetical protein